MPSDPRTATMPGRFGQNCTGRVTLFAEANGFQIDGASCAR